MKEDNTPKRFVATVTSTGRVTIPAKIREHLSIKAGDQTRFIINEAGIVLLAKVPT